MKIPNFEHPKNCKRGELDLKRARCHGLRAQRVQKDKVKRPERASSKKSGPEGPLDIWCYILYSIE